jgi:hypothetical protein
LGNDDVPAGLWPAQTDEHLPRRDAHGFLIIDHWWGRALYYGKLLKLALKADSRSTEISEAKECLAR